MAKRRRASREKVKSRRSVTFKSKTSNLSWLWYFPSLRSWFKTDQLSLKEAFLARIN
jgi:hypothetical protein